jgi:O-antigen/teichoic acid export membrane protein
MPTHSQSSRIMLLLGGNGLGQLITIAAIPILSRLYDPADFGLLAGILSVVSLSAVVVHGRYHMAIPVSQNDNEAVALFALAMALSVVLAPIVVLLVVFLIGGSVGGTNFLLFVGVAVAFTLITAMIDIFAYWRSHRQRFNVSARNAIARAGVTAGVQIALSPISSIGLVGGAMAGALAALALSIRDVMRLDMERLSWPSWKHLWVAARHYSGYPLFGLPQGLIAAVSWNALPLLLLRYSGAEAAGQYWLAYRVLMAPLALLNGSYRQATLPILGQGDRPAAIRLSRQHSLNLLLMAASAAAVLFVFGETVIAQILGQEWREAGAMAAWLGIGVAADVVKIPAMCLLQCRAGHRSILVWEAVIAAARYGLMLPYLIGGNVITAIAAFSLIGLVGWMSFSIYCLFGTMKPETVEAEGKN